MNNFLSNKYLVLASRAVLGTMFIIASIDKIAEPGAFAASIQAYQLVPFAFVNLFAIVLAWLELLCGIFLLSGILVRSSSLILSALLCMFIAAMLASMARGLNIDCGCFGQQYSSPVGWTRILEDLGLFILGIYLFFSESHRFSLVNIKAPTD